jgi:hypothetical protein
MREASGVSSRLRDRGARYGVGAGNAGEGETAARVRVEGLREEAAWLAGELEAAEIEPA